MVAIFVAFMFVGLILLDSGVEKWKEWQTARAACSTSARRAFALPTRWQLPDGIHIADTHTWFRPDPNGGLEVGTDTLITYAVGAVRRIILPQVGDHVAIGQPLFRLEHNGAAMTVPSCVTGRVTAVNNHLMEEPELLSSDPYGRGWVCYVTPTSLEKGSPITRFGEEALMWLDAEFGRFREFIVTQLSPDLALGFTSQDGGLPAVGCLSELGPTTWVSFEEQFLRGR